MNNLEDLEKKINSELNTKIKESKINHNQLYLDIEADDLIDVCMFVKTNKDTKFRQLIDITAVDYLQKSKRFKLVYLLLSHEFNQRMIISYFVSENEIIKSLTKVFPAAN
jgi:NADH:ubiquinone oxidoreductase 27 kD subunit